MKFSKIEKLTTTAILTAIVFILQFIGSFIRFGQFSISLVLVPIIIGVVVAGTGAGVWLGLAFGLAVLASGDAASFLAISPFGAVVTVLAKGMLAGLCAALVFKLFSKRSPYIGAVAAGAVCPIVNTGVFLLGCRLFFIDAIAQQASAMGQGVVAYMLLVLVGGNFIFEIVLNIVLAPVVVRIIKAVKM